MLLVQLLFILFFYLNFQRTGRIASPDRGASAVNDRPAFQVAAQHRSDGSPPARTRCQLEHQPGHGRPRHPCCHDSSRPQLGKSRQFPLAKNWSYHKNRYFPINPSLCSDFFRGLILKLTRIYFLNIILLLLQLVVYFIFN